MPTQEEVITALKQVYDPEIPVNIYDLGLIYQVDVQNEQVNVTMSLTSTSCPSAKAIPDLIKTRVSVIPHVTSVQVQVVWEPKWNPSMISPEGRKILKLDDES